MGAAAAVIAMKIFKRADVKLGSMRSVLDGSTGARESDKHIEGAVRAIHQLSYVLEKVSLANEAASKNDSPNKSNGIHVALSRLRNDVHLAQF